MHRPVKSLPCSSSCCGASFSPVVPVSLGPKCRQLQCRHAQPASVLLSAHPSRLTAIHKATKADSGPITLYTPSSARDAVERATAALKQQGDASEAVRLYKLAMSMQPSEDEARAALYNMGCALAKQKQWAAAAGAITAAINDRGLKISVAQQVCVSVCGGGEGACGPAY